MIRLNEQQGEKPDPAVVRWLLDSDPSIRWQVMQDLTDASEETVAKERARVAIEGLGAHLFATQEENGSWAGEAWNSGFNATMHVLWLMRDLGVDTASDPARRAVDRVRERVHWRGWDTEGHWQGFEFTGAPFFWGEVEPCINGQVGAGGAYFGQDVEHIIQRLLREQLEDGGWNCWTEQGSTRGSFNTTICVLEGLLEHEKQFGSRPEVKNARLRGEEYLLERRLFHRKSTGEVIERDRMDGHQWSQFAFPTWWHYDVLRGLDYLRRAGVKPDERVKEAVEMVASKQDSEGRWPLEVQYEGNMPVELGEVVGQPSQWNTLRALRVLKWYSEFS